MNARILLVDDDAGVREALAFTLSERGLVVDVAGDAQAALAQHERAVPDVVLTDIRMPGMSGIELVRTLSAQSSTARMVVMTAYGSVDTAVEAMRAGAHDFITKPVATDALVLVLERVLRQRDLESENASLKAQLSDQESAEPRILAVSAAMKATLALTDRIANTDATVLIMGESGTGKELIARRLHDHSARREHPFVAINCSALPADLLEAELFGFEKGAFTGATRPRRGRFVEASGGTLFLDEIGEMPPALQAKLLRVLQERVVDVVGGGPVAVDVRIVAATHRNLLDMVQAGTFREDLYFRLNVVPVIIPALRDRPEDVGPLFLRFLAGAGRELKQTPKRATPALLTLLATRPWPGNVREVENLATRLSLVKETATLDASDLEEGDGAARDGALAARRRDHVAGTGPHISAAGELVLPERGVSLEALERAVVVAALSACRGNQSKAARFLRVPRHVLLYRIEKYGVVDADWTAQAPKPRAPLDRPPASDEVGS